MPRVATYISNGLYKALQDTCYSSQQARTMADMVARLIQRHADRPLPERVKSETFDSVKGLVHESLEVVPEELQRDMLFFLGTAVPAVCGQLGFSAEERDELYGVVTDATEALGVKTFYRSVTKAWAKAEDGGKSTKSFNLSDEGFEALDQVLLEELGARFTDLREYSRKLNRGGWVSNAIAVGCLERAVERAKAGRAPRNAPARMSGWGKG